MSDQAAVIKQLRRIPGVGKEIAADLYGLGFRSIEDLRGRDPEGIYLNHCRLKGCKVDRCMLYVFRVAVVTYPVAHGSIRAAFRKRQLPGHRSQLDGLHQGGGEPGPGDVVVGPVPSG